MTLIFAISNNDESCFASICSELTMSMQDRVLIPVSGSEEYVVHLTKEKS